MSRRILLGSVRIHAAARSAAWHPICAVATAVALAWTTPAAGQPVAGPWHADLARARAVSATSQRPVLAVFVASWSESSRRIATSLQADAEVHALVSACFEPTVVDVDADAELTRRLEITHVPTAVVLDAADRPLASFECPEAAPAFIAAAAEAARTAAARITPPGPSDPFAAGSGPDDSGRGSISMLTAKVRQLSDFAGEPAPPRGGIVARPLDLQDAFAATPAPPQEPALPRSPPTWNAERPAAPLALTPSPPQPRPAIEPATQAPAARPQTTPERTPWIAAAATAEPESNASISDLPGPAPQAPAARKPAVGFWSGIRNPFASLAAKPVLPTAKPEPPPTMPPARPQWPAPLAAASPPAKPPAAAVPPTPASPAAPVAPPATATAITAAAEQQAMPLGLEGYCPVTLAEKQAWAEGRPQYGVRHRGRTYLFAGPEQQQAFLADPDRYAPALSGDDPVLAFEQGKSMPGQRRYGVVCQSRMYLFTSPQTRDAFSADPEKYTGRVAMAEQTAAAGTRTY